MMQPNPHYTYMQQAYNMPTYERLLINCGVLTETNKLLQNEVVNLKGHLNGANQKIADLLSEKSVGKNAATVTKDAEKNKKEFAFFKQLLLDLCKESLAKITAFNEKRVQSIVDLEIMTSPESTYSSEILSIYHKNIVLLEDLRKDISNKETIIKKFKANLEKITNFDEVMKFVNKVNIQMIVDIVNDLIIQFFDQYVSILQQLLRHKKSVHKRSLQTTTAISTFSTPVPDAKKPEVKELKIADKTKTKILITSSMTPRKSLKDSLKDLKLNNNYKKIADIKDHPHYSFISSNEKYRSLFNKLTKELEGKPHIDILDALMEVRNEHNNCLSLLKYAEIVSKISQILTRKKSEIGTFPVFNLSVHKDTYETCGICIQPIYMNAAKKLPCKHIFHKDCIKTWLNANHTCPICRIFVP